MMAEGEKSRSKDLKPDALVEKLVPDPSQPQPVEAVAFAGFLGASPKPGQVRLYLTPQMNDYLEISQDDVTHRQSLASEQAPMAGSVVWVKRTAKLDRVRTQATQAQAEFLQGDLLSQFLGGGTTGLPGGGALGESLRKARTGTWCDVSIAVSIVSLVASTVVLTSASPITVTPTTVATAERASAPGGAAQLMREPTLVTRFLFCPQTQAPWCGGAPSITGGGVSFN